LLVSGIGLASGSKGPGKSGWLDECAVVFEDGAELIYNNDDILDVLWIRE
jgi:hypothetical protein